MLGKSSWTYLVLMANGRNSIGPHLMGIKSISVYIRHVQVCPDLPCTLHYLGSGVLWEVFLPVLSHFPP